MVDVYHWMHVPWEFTLLRAGRQAGSLLVGQEGGQFCMVTASFGPSTSWPRCTATLQREFKMPTHLCCVEKYAGTVPSSLLCTAPSAVSDIIRITLAGNMVQRCYFLSPWRKISRLIVTTATAEALISTLKSTEDISISKLHQKQKCDQIE